MPYVDALLPDLGRDSAFTAKALLSLLLRPEKPPLLGRPIRLCARAEAAPDGIFDVGLTVIFA